MKTKKFKIQRISSGYYKVIGFIEEVFIHLMFHEEERKEYWYIEVDGYVDDLYDTKREIVEVVIPEFIEGKSLNFK